MNFFNRAIKNVTRKLSKTILLIITFFVIGNFVIVGLSVATASESAKVLTRKKMRAVVTYEVDYDAFNEAASKIEDEDEQNEFYNNTPTIKYSDVEKVLTDSRVKTANALNTQTLYKSESLDYVHLNNKYEQSMSDYEDQYCYTDESGNETCESYQETAFMAKGNFFPDMIEFADNDYTIADGRFYTEEEIKNNANVCLITSALAEQNGISVGDTIKLCIGTLSSNYVAAGVTEDEVNIDFEVIGIYNHNNPITPDNSNYDYLSPYENPDNLILLPGSTLSNIQIPVSQKMFDYYKTQQPDSTYYQDESNRPVEGTLDSIKLYDVTFLLNDPLEVDAFTEEYNLNPGEYKKFNANNEEFEKLSKPLDTLSDYANFIVWLVVINAIVIISLVTALTLKTRESEIGILLSVGASKLKVVLQFFVELAIVALVGFTLAVGTGSLISKKVGAVLLENQIESSGVTQEDSSSDYYNPWDNNYTTDISLEDLLSEYDVTVSPLIIAEIYVVGLGIVLISVIIPSIMIMRFNPKKILMAQG